MQLQGEHELPMSLARSWQALNDPTLLMAAIPGCEAIVPLADDADDGPARASSSDRALDPPARRYELVMVASIGPMKPKFKGRLELTDLEPPASYVLRFDGRNVLAGGAQGRAAVRLVAIDDGRTRLAYDADVTVDGRLAKIGGRLVDVAARRIADRFFERFVDAVRARAAG